MPSPYCHKSCQSNEQFICVGVWGTHVEIVAAAGAFNKSVFVALRKGVSSNFYWAQYFGKPKDEWVYPTSESQSNCATNTHGPSPS